MERRLIMEMIKNGKKIEGLIYNQTHYFSNVSYLKTNSYYYRSCNVSSGSEQTEGNKITFSITNSSFQLYRATNLQTPLSALPVHKFVFKNLTDIDISSLLTLVYDGENNFHIEGDVSSLSGYVTGKYGRSEIGIYLEDENGDIFYCSAFPISYAINTTAETVSYTSSTLTASNIENISSQKQITLPYSLQTSPDNPFTLVMSGTYSFGFGTNTYQII